MRYVKPFFAFLAPLPLALIAACSSYPAPTARLASTEAAYRAAEETGARDNPQAQLHMKLAQDGLAKAKTAMNDGDNKRADFLLVRAKSDAELALALSREQSARADAEQVKNEARALHQSLNQ